ncbi:hypothetical protein LUZ63_007583 [Rhynchospora breviuscula]|uniref:BED-type domain-containing protein n=1 Tax=Rhynchospora breviuscula TaxID=2022672 RepID=A0A9Q0HUP5_9POAL|nr:hypothetical protein LUZ63_007583 [Rhynchospora breviuscula]
MAGLEEVTSVESDSEPDIAEDIANENDMGLHPGLTGDQIERIVHEANAQDPQGAPQGENIEAHAAEGGVQITKKRNVREKMTAMVWKHFTKGPVQDDGSYDAVCNYCGQVYPMGNQRGTGSLNHHIKSGCKKVPRDRGFIALTCHYIDDDWIIRKRILNFSPLPSPHTGKNIAEALLSMLVMWNLDKRAFSLVLDNASSNDACIRELLSGSLKEALPAGGSVFHQRCGCHILNLIVQDGLSELSDEITKVRETMKYIRHSQARMEKFRLAASQVKASDKRPVWDVPTRWNSTYLMLELALQLRPAIDSALFKEYLEAYSIKLQSQPSASRPQNQSKQACVASSVTVSQVRAGLKDFISEKQTSELEKSELEEYLSLPLDKTGVDDEFDILTWWKMKVPKYLVLSRLARDILAVPASTVASESTFSTSGRTLSAVRNCLNDESIEALICAQDWLRARVAENGGRVGGPIWATAESVSDDTDFDDLLFIL